MKAYLVANRTTYDTTAKEFQQKKAERVPGARRLIELFVRLVPGLSPGTVLELGVGNGQAAAMLSESGLQVTGIEFSHKMAQLARQNAPKVTIIEDEFLQHNFNGTQYDAIYAVAFIHLFPTNDAVGVAAKAFGLLKPGGIALFSTTKHSEIKEGYATKQGFNSPAKRYRKEYTVEAFIELLTTADFEVLSSEENPDPTEADKVWINMFVKKQQR